MKAALKAIASGVATLAVLPAVVLYRLGALAMGEARAFPGWSEAFSLLPGITGVYLRRAFYRLVFPRCGPDVWIGFGTVFSHPTAELGRRVYVGNYCVIGDASLEDDALIASHVSIVNGGRQHGIERLDVPIREQPGTWQRIAIGRDAWLGERSVVLADVGAHCVVGAGSVVTKPVADCAIVAGVPAKLLRYRGEDADGPRSEEFRGRVGSIESRDPIANSAG
jgi:acetyltransferase-like isoleucine patch superfamily enzyme